MTAPASPEAGRLTGEALEAIEARLNVTRPDGSVVEWMRSIRQDQEALIAEVRRLRELVEDAFREGIVFGGAVECSFCESDLQAAWRESESYAELSPVPPGGARE